MVQLKVNEVINAVVGARKLSEQTLPYQASLTILKLLRELEGYGNDIDKQRARIIKRWAKQAGKGDATKEERDEARAEMDKLLECTVTIQTTLNLADLGTEPFDAAPRHALGKLLISPELEQIPYEKPDWVVSDEEVE